MKKISKYVKREGAIMGATTKKKILIVDDDPDMLEIATASLVVNGFDVITASDGEEGFQRAKAEKPDLILLDVMMTTPEEGFVIAQELHADPDTKNIPVILLTSVSQVTGYHFDPQKNPDYLPVKDFIEKPFKTEDLLQRIKKALAE